MSVDDDLGLSQHLAAEGRLRFFRANKVTILFGREGDGAYRKLCHIAFNKKSGAIYAQFTYFESGPGVVGFVTCSIGADGSSSVGWENGGKVATNLVKYSHPPDGRAHFSQDGSHQTQFWSDSLDLRTDEGHLFEIHAFNLEPFKILKKSEVALGRRLYLPFQADGKPEGVSVSAEWRSLSKVSQIASPNDPVAGPLVLLPRSQDGKLFKAALVAPSDDSPLRERVLLLNVHPLQPPPGATEPMLFFMGGWSKRDSFSPGSTASFLSFTYPVASPDELARRLGISDLGLDTNP